jgi:hypothetical protein
MSTTILCPQGHSITIEASDERVRCCPRCGAIIDPDAGTESDPIAGPYGMAARPQRPRGRDVDEDDRPRKRRPRDDDDNDDDDEPRGKGRPSAEDDDDDDDAVERVLTRKQKQMSMVRVGIVFHMVKLWIFMASLLFAFITLPVMLFLLMTVHNFWATVLLQITYNLGISAAPLCGIVGSILCGFVPPRSEARGLIIVSLVFDFITPFFGLFQLVFWMGFIMGHDERVERLIDYMNYARMACTLTAWWLFQLYLRKLCFYMRETLLASESLNVIVHLMLACIVLPTLITASLAFFMVFGPGDLIALILFLAAVAYLIFFAITFPWRQFSLLVMIRHRIWEKFLKPED